MATIGAGIDLRLIAADEEAGRHAHRVGDEPAMVERPRRGEPARTRAPSFWPARRNPAARRWNWLGDPPDAAIIDLTYAAEDVPTRGCARRWSSRSWIRGAARGGAST